MEAAHAEALLAVSGLVPEHPRWRVPPLPQRPPQWTRQSLEAFVAETEAWIAKVKRKLGRPPGLRKDLDRVWSRYAVWAWDYHVRGLTWGDIAVRDLPENPDDPEARDPRERDGEVLQGAGEALAVGADGLGPRYLRLLADIFTSRARFEEKRVANPQRPDLPPVGD